MTHPTRPSSRHQPSIAERATELGDKLAACERLLDRAKLFGEYAHGVSLFAAGHREALVRDVEALAVDVYVKVLERVMGSGLSKKDLRADAKKIARSQIDRAGGDAGILMGLVRDLAEAHAAAKTLD